MIEQANLTELEKIKAGSRYLRGSVARELESKDDRFSHETVQVLKHHGMYQQTDRDRRTAKDEPKAYSMMVRTKLPGGRLTGEQFLAHLDIADELADGTLRLTTRQDIQIYRIAKSRVKEAVQSINAMGLTTLGACGDVGRNVLCCPAPANDTPIHEQIQLLAQQISDHLLPSTTAYGEIWLDRPGDKDRENGEPLYFEGYLPRKLKIGIATTDDNCVDIYTHDLGLLAICEDSRIVGYNVLVGGGMGVTPANPKTFPALARPMAFVEPHEVLDLVVALVSVFRDFGNRTDRKQARLKYLIAELRLERFKAQVEQYYGKPLAPPRQVGVSDVKNHVGWKEQGDGRWFLGLLVEHGRVADGDKVKWKTALRTILGSVESNVRLTPQQSLLLTDIENDKRQFVDDVLCRHGIGPAEGVSPVRRWAMACVALPTCPMAITEAERALPDVISGVERELAELGLGDETFTVRMTGCSNGCARPYNADIGLVGRAKGRYAVYLGGRLLGDRLAFLYEDKVPLEQVVPLLTRLFSIFARQRQAGESFGDFCKRKGIDSLRKAEQ